MCCNVDSSRGAGLNYMPSVVSVRRDEDISLGVEGDGGIGSDIFGSLYGLYSIIVSKDVNN